MARLFPQALRLFTVTRQAIVKQANGNRETTTVTVATDQSISLGVKRQDIAATDAGDIYESSYVGATFLDANIYLKDILIDQAEKESDDSAIKYTVTGKILGPFSMHLTLARTKPV